MAEEPDQNQNQNENQNECRAVKPISDVKISSSLHALLFGYEQVMKKFFEQEYRNLLGYIIEEIEPIFYEENTPIIDKNLSLDENIERLTKFLSNPDYFENLTIRRLDEQHLVLDIGVCNFARCGVHEVLNIDTIKGYCPIALIVAATLCGIEDATQYIEITDSEFTESGSKTKLKIK